MKRLTILIFLSVVSNAYAQDWPVKKMVMAAAAKQIPFTSIPAFSFVENKILTGRGTYQQLRLNTTFTNQLLAQRPAAIQLTIPLSNNKSITCHLVKFSIGNIKFTQNNRGIISNVKIPVTYRGIVAGEPVINNVVLTVNEDYLSLVATMSDKVIQVTKADEENRALYRLYNSESVQFPVVPFECGTSDNTPAQTRTGISLTGVERAAAVQDKCVNVFVDCFDSLYQWKGSNSQQTINYVFELFNAVTTGYYNEQVNVQITTINVWTTTDPFRGDTRENALADLAAYHQDNFWGNICVGLDYSIYARSRSGLAGDIGRVKAVSANTCPAYTTTNSACCYSDLDYTVSVRNFPVGPNTTGPQVYLVMHEMGHLLGAHHTKWCGWQLTSNPNTYGALDSCGGMEGTCTQGPPPTSIGATIMSYCVTGNNANQYVNYINGFGTLPGNAIRSFVDQSACILNCVDCFGLLNRGNTNTLAFNELVGNPALKNENGEGKSGRGLPLQNSQPAGAALITKTKK